ncbi:MAG: hypothetical protein US44_C0009G0009 [Candidatus Moranbacteria bacterium GW2011_GWD1_37_17]|nr:MAG: hypothetical protein US44_C0009G0009 [Candidatus Moranbacteria bacterium GW2011_GWD1_37_17]
MLSYKKTTHTDYVTVDRGVMEIFSLRSNVDLRLSLPQ